MEAELDEISSTLMNRATMENSNETDDDSETSESAEVRTDDSESGEDDEDTEYGLASNKNAPSVSKTIKGNVSESEETSTDLSDGSNGEDTSDSATEDEDTCKPLAASNDETDDSHGMDSKRVVTDRGGGDADQPHYDTDVFTIADDGTRCATMKVKIVAKKREHDPQAYQKWIKAKNEEIRRNREMEKLRALQLDEHKRHEEEQRKKMNKAKVEQWMQRKKQKECSGTSMETTSSSTQQFIQNDADARFKAWLQRVKQRDEENRAKAMLQKQRETEERNHKKKVSREICSEWLKAAKNKPRPVPMNQGLHTLKGTVSKIFINPEPWKSNSD